MLIQEEEIERCSTHANSRGRDREVEHANSRGRDRGVVC